MQGRVLVWQPAEQSSPRQYKGAADILSIRVLWNLCTSLIKMFIDLLRTHTKCNQKFPDRIDNEIYAYNNKHSLGSNTKGCGGKTHYTDSQNNDATASSGKELYRLQFSLKVASPETSGYTLVPTVTKLITL
jgi:hypothetical protein